jgi:GNAT acetyltransferase-like protein
VFHTPAWLEALQRTYGYESLAYTTTPPGIELTNGLVVCRVYSLITGRRAVSLPFSDHCEPLVERPEELESLIHSLELDCISEDWKYLEVRPRTALAAPPPGLEPAQAFYLHSVDLTPEIEDIFSRLHKDSTQRKIRRAERERLTYEEGRSDAMLEKFYQLLLLTRRRQHLPPQPRAWFHNLVGCLGDSIKLRIASKDGRPVASIITLSFKDVLVYKYGCSDERFHNLGGMQLLLWNALQDGKRNGAREFDLGRSASDNPGLSIFKDRWGAVRSQLTYWRYLAPLAPLTAPGWRTKVAQRIFPRIPDSLLTAAWRTKVAKMISPLIPDSLLIAAGRLLYKHIG